MKTERQELADAIVARWSENHKKSMVSLLVMLKLSREKLWAEELWHWLDKVAGWQLSERGLHRVLRNLSDAGLLDYYKTSSTRAGAERKVYELSQFGREVLAKLINESLIYPRNREIHSLIKKAARYPYE